MFSAYTGASPTLDENDHRTKPARRSTLAVAPLSGTIFSSPLRNDGKKPSLMNDIGAFEPVDFAIDPDEFQTVQTKARCLANKKDMASQRDGQN